MRINKYIAQATGLSRRAVDTQIAHGQVTVNGKQPTAGQDVSDQDDVTLEGKLVPKLAGHAITTIILNKPVGYVCSRDGQGSKTVYDLLPEELKSLKPVGRLDKDSSGLLLLTDDGKLAHELTHPSFQKQKVYEIQLHKDLSESDYRSITGTGVMLEDGTSQFDLKRLDERSNRNWQVTMSEGRNRQIRRTFSALDYTVTKLHRVQFGEYKLSNLQFGKYKPVI